MHMYSRRKRITDIYTSVSYSSTAASAYILNYVNKWEKGVFLSVSQLTRHSVNIEFTRRIPPSPHASLIKKMNSKLVHCSPIH